VPDGLQAKRELVEGVVSRLGLDSCRDTRIGSVLSRGISGGEVLPNLPRVNVCHRACSCQPPLYPSPQHT